MASRPSRGALLGALAALLAERRPAHALRVAVDGPDAAGKTTFAGDLAASLAGQRDIIRSGIDGFHRPREDRPVRRS